MSRINIQGLINNMTQRVSRAIGYQIELKCARDYWDLASVLPSIAFRGIALRYNRLIARHQWHKAVALAVLLSLVLGLIVGSIVGTNWWRQQQTEQALHTARQEFAQMSVQLAAQRSVQDLSQNQLKNQAKNQPSAAPRASLVQSILDAGATIEHLDRVGAEQNSTQTSMQKSGQAINLTMLIKPEQLPAVLAVLTQSDIQELDIQPHEHDVRVRAHVYADMN